MKRRGQGRIPQSLKLNRLYEIGTRSGLRLPDVSIRRRANNTRRNLTDGYVSRYRITMHYRPNAIKTNADEKRGKFLPLRFKALEDEIREPSSAMDALRTVLYKRLFLTERIKSR